MRFRKGLLGIAGLAAATALALTPAAASAAGGPGGGGGHGNGGGAGHGAGGGGVGQGGPGKGGPPTTEAANNLSVPTVFVGGTGDFTLHPTDPVGSVLDPQGTPTPITTTPVLPEGSEPYTYFYVQGENTWQATYTEAAAATATAAWGENLATGSASLKAGHPVRVEMSLTNAIVDGTAVMGTGFNVYKLDGSVADRLSPYGTPAVSSAGPGIEVSMPARVWGPGATLSITAPDGQTEAVPMPGEINATGAIVFGYNWRPSEPGVYTLTFNQPSGITIANPDNLSIKADVTSSGGGGGGGGPH